MKGDLRNLATAQEAYYGDNNVYYSGALPSAALHLQSVAGRNRHHYGGGQHRLGGHDRVSEHHAAHLCAVPGIRVAAGARRRSRV